MQSRDNFVVGFYGYTEDEFRSLFSEIPERYTGELQRYYELWLISQIHEWVDAGATSFVTTIQNGVCNWIAKQIVTNNNLHPEDHIELWIVLPADLKKRRYLFDEWTVITCVDGHHIADGVENEDIVQCMMRECDQMLLFASDTRSDMFIRESASRRVKLDIFDPVDIIKGYCQVREKHKTQSRGNIVDLNDYQEPSS